MFSPGSERLRYLIPFADAQQTIDYLRTVGENTPNAVAVFGDDGEKFGTWPDTKQHVYDNGWLRHFFSLLSDNSDWVSTCTLSEARDQTPSVGKIFIPEGSYREMTEWALPAERQMAFDDLKHRMHDHPNWAEIEQFVKGGFWRNFKARYPESDEMYCRMLGVSQQLEALESEGADHPGLDDARRELYRGQCNCSYWHGAFGGIYLPHLRNAVFHHLLKAEQYLDQALGHSAPYADAQASDLNLDGQNEIRLENDKFVTFIQPTQGGQIYELDVRSIHHNLLATLARRPEAYHQKVRGGANNGGDGVASIHDRVVFKQEGLDQKLFFDTLPRKMLMDRFYAAETSLESVIRGEAKAFEAFLTSPYEAVIRRKQDRTQVMLSAVGDADGVTVKITKLITLQAGSPTVELAYMLEGLPQDRTLHFGIEMNFAGLPPHQDDRYFFQHDGEKIGHFGECIDAAELEMIGLADDWLGIRIELAIDRPTPIWAHPVETVSQSEGGFELVHQSVALQPHWMVTGDSEGRWKANMRLNIQTPHAPEQAPARRNRSALAEVGQKLTPTSEPAIVPVA